MMRGALCTRPALVRGNLPIVDGNAFLMRVLVVRDCAFALLLHSLAERMYSIEDERARVTDKK